MTANGYTGSGGGGGGGSVAWSDITGKPTTFATTAALITDGTTVGRALVVAANAAAARTAIGAGTSSLVIGTSAGTAADGADSRIVGAAQKASNLSDLASVSTARTNLGLAGAALLNVGTSAGTVAAGDDSRITGAAQKASNLSDLANAGTARTNLGLGNSATRAVGTASTDVAAGDAPAGAITTHLAAGDPHPQYEVTYVESAGTYAISNGARSFVGTDDPATKGFTLVTGDRWYTV